MLNRFARLALLFLVASPEALAQRGGHSDPAIGIKIRPPSNWVYLGNEGDLGSLRGLYASPRAYAARAARGVSHTPTMRVLWFAKAAAAEASAKGGQENKGADEFPMLTPYTSFKDYIGRVHGPRTKIGDVEAAAIGKLRGRRYVATVPRDAGAGLTLHVGVVGVEGGEVAVEYEVLTEHYPKLKKQFDKSLTTLSAMTPKAAAAAARPPWEKDRAAWLKLPAIDRQAKREAFGKAWLATRKAVKEAGWRQTKHKRYLILSRADSKFTKRVAKAIDVIHPWATGWLNAVSDEAVMPAVVRVFADRREFNVYRLRDTNKDEYQPSTREIHCFKDASVGNTGGGFSGLIRGVFQQILHDKHPHVQRNLPRWLSNGLWAFMDSNNLKGKKLVFFPSTVEMGRYQYHKQNNSRPVLWGLIQEKAYETPKDGAVEEPWGYTPECARLLRWFEDGGSKAFEKESFLAPYLRQVGDSAVKAPPDPSVGVDALRLDDGQVKRLRALTYERRDKLLAEINNAVIPLTVGAWKSADAAFMAYNQKYKPPKH